MKPDTVLKKNLLMLKFVWNASHIFFFQALLLIALQVSNNLLFILFGKFALDILTNHGEFSHILVFCGILLLNSALLQVYSSWYYMIKTKLVSLKVQQTMQCAMFAKAKELDLGCYESGTFYDQYVRAMPEASGRAMGVFNTCVDFLNNTLSILSVLGVIITLDAFMILFVIVNLVVTLFMVNVQNKALYQYNIGEQAIDRQRDYVKRIFYLSEYAKELKIFPVVGRLVAKFTDETNKMRALIKKHFPKIFMLDAGSGLVTKSIQILMILYLCFGVLTGHITVGDFLALERSTSSLASSIIRLFNVVTDFKRHGLYIDNYLTFMNYEPLIKTDETKEALNPNVPMEFKLDRVRFLYPTAHDYTINDISLEIKSGEKVAIVGYNGAGKTTLVKLLMRLYDATEGGIYINGKPIGDYNVRSIRDNIGVVFQDSNFYALSIKDNIAPEDAGYSDDQIVDALKKSKLYDKISALPMGIDSPVSKELSQEGAVFSGGEQQSLFLARVFLENQKTLILDEPSSALDPIAEDRVLSTMFELAAGKTVIMIAHRLSCVKYVDRIIFMEKGAVREAGTHNELVKLNGMYAEMYRTQAKHYFNMEEKS